jgi:hypothetical protein
MLSAAKHLFFLIENKQSRSFASLKDDTVGGSSDVGKGVQGIPGGVNKAIMLLGINDLAQETKPKQTQIQAIKSFRS